MFQLVSHKRNVDLPNGVKAKKSKALFPGARQGCYLMEKADTGALTTVELLNIPVDLRRKLCSAFSGSLHCQYQLHITRHPVPCGSDRSFHKDFAVSVIQSI